MNHDVPDTGEPTGQRIATKTWFLDELAFAGRENLDAAHACVYDQKEPAQADAEVARLRKFGLGPSSRVIDFGAGTGQFTLAAAHMGAQVIAVDVSPVMLEQLRRKLAMEHIQNVEVANAGFLTYHHTGELADIMYSRLALHHLPDFWKALALVRMRQMLQRGGVLRVWDVIFDFDADEAVERLDAWCDMFDENPPPGQWGRRDVEEHLRDEHSTYRWLFEPMLQRAGFEIQDVAFSRDGFFGRYVAVAI